MLDFGFIFGNKVIKKTNPEEELQGLVCFDRMSS